MIIKIEWKLLKQRKVNGFQWRIVVCIIFKQWFKYVMNNFQDEFGY